MITSYICICTYVSVCMKMHLILCDKLTTPTVHIDTYMYKYKKYLWTTNQTTVNQSIWSVSGNKCSGLYTRVGGEGCGAAEQEAATGICLSTQTSRPLEQFATKATRARSIVCDASIGSIGCNSNASIETKRNELKSFLIGPVEFGLWLRRQSLQLLVFNFLYVGCINSHNNSCYSRQCFIN